jgi:hypothetical protein
MGRVNGLAKVLLCALVATGCLEPDPDPILAGAAIADVTPWFEPFVDENQNRVFDAGESFDDLDGDGQLDTLWIGGFGDRQPTGVHDALWARTVALKLSSGTYSFTSIDTLGLSTGRMDAARLKAWRELMDMGIELPIGNMVIASTHSHQTPDTIGIFGPDLITPGWDADYLDLVVERTAASIVEAASRLEPVRLVITTVEAGEGYVVDLRPPDIIDPAVGILQARTPEGRVVATLASIANHPEAVFGRSLEISSDFPHYFRQRVENRLGGIAIYFSADLGMMQSPAKIGEPGYERARVVGEAYADLVSDAAEGADPYPAADLAARSLSDTVTVGLSSLELRWAVDLDVLEGLKDYIYDSDQPPCAESYGCFDVPVFMLRLGDVLTLVTIPGEMTPELVVGGIVRPPDCTGPFPDAPAEPVLMDHLGTGHRFLMGLAQAEMGYIYPKMTYDPDRSSAYGNSAGPDTAMQVMTGMVEMLDRLNLLDPQ